MEGTDKRQPFQGSGMLDGLHSNVIHLDQIHVVANGALAEKVECDDFEAAKIEMKTACSMVNLQCSWDVK